MLSLSNVELINYISDKWKDSQIILYTNGVNLLKYYDLLPLEKINEVNVSLDGIKKTHLSRRYENYNVGREDVYDNIINGIKRLLDDKVYVRIKTAIDKRNYKEFNTFKEFLKRQKILESPYFKHSVGIIEDFSKHNNLHADYNSINDIKAMKKFFAQTELYSHPLIPGLTILNEIVSRPLNEPFYPKVTRCDTRLLSKYFFSPNGKIYFCDCHNEEKGIVGEYYPKRYLKKWLMT